VQPLAVTVFATWQVDIPYSYTEGVKS